MRRVHRFYPKTELIDYYMANTGSSSFMMQFTEVNFELSENLDE
jgi:hypothetical protein